MTNNPFGNATLDGEQTPFVGIGNHLLSCFDMFNKKTRNSGEVFYVEFTVSESDAADHHEGQKRRVMFRIYDQKTDVREAAQRNLLRFFKELSGLEKEDEIKTFGMKAMANPDAVKDVLVHCKGTQATNRDGVALTSKRGDPITNYEWAHSIQQAGLEERNKSNERSVLL